MVNKHVRRYDFTWDLSYHNYHSCISISQVEIYVTYWGIFIRFTPMVLQARSRSSTGNCNKLNEYANSGGLHHTHTIFRGNPASMVYLEGFKRLMLWDRSPPTGEPVPLYFKQFPALSDAMRIPLLLPKLCIGMKRAARSNNIGCILHYKLNLEDYKLRNLNLGDQLIPVNSEIPRQMGQLTPSVPALVSEICGSPYSPNITLCVDGGLRWSDRSGRIYTSEALLKSPDDNSDKAQSLEGSVTPNPSGRGTGIIDVLVQTVVNSWARNEGIHNTSGLSTINRRFTANIYPH